MALGADRARVRRLIVEAAPRPVAGGLAIGLAGAAASSSLLSGMLFGVPRVDPFTYGVVGLVFVGVGYLASWAPAREATRIDPQVALRSE